MCQNAASRSLATPKLRLRYGEPSPGDLVLTAHGGAVTIDHADPVILVSHELLADLLYRTHQAGWLLGAARLRLVPGAEPWSMSETDAPRFPIGRERDGTATALIPDFTGARLTVYAANMNAVYVVIEYVGDLTWRAQWPA